MLWNDFCLMLSLTKCSPSVDVLLISKWTNPIYQALVLQSSLVEFMMSWSVSVMSYNGSIRGRPYLRRSKEFSETWNFKRCSQMLLFESTYSSVISLWLIYMVIVTILIQISSKYLTIILRYKRMLTFDEIIFNIRLRKINRL